MTVEHATGIVLRTRPLTETSLIVQWVTPEFGRIATVAKGALRPKSLFRGRLDLFYTADLAFQRSRRSTLHTLREVVLRDSHPALRGDYARLRQASYGARLLEQLTEEETPLPEFFRLFGELLATLARWPARPTFLFAYELRLLAASGLQPDLTRAHLGEGSRKAVAALQAGDFESVAALRLSSAQAAEIRQFLHGFLIYHTGRVPGGRAAALDPSL